MSDIVKKTEQLPADFGANLMRGIEQTRSTIGVGTGHPYMRLTKGGEFIYGMEDVEVQEGSHWAVNCASLEHGWVCWGGGSLLGQIMASVQTDVPHRPPPIEGYDFKPQWGMELACISGDDKGQEVIYRNNSNGYKKGFDKLLADIRSRYPIDQQYYWPIVELVSTHWQSKQYGRIYEPVFKVVAWADAQGNLQSAKPRAVSQTKPETEKRTSEFRSSAQVEAAAEPAEEPVAAPRVGQRRRPAAR